MNEPTIKLTDTLLLDDELFAQIKAGRKRATTRRGFVAVTNPYLTLVGTTDNSKVLKVRVTDIVYTIFGALADWQGRYEGYVSVVGLKNALRHYYPDIQPDDTGTQIVFDGVE